MNDLVEICNSLARNVGGAIVAKALVEKLLGPSADYVGRAMSELLQRFGNKNLHDIFSGMASKLGGRLTSDEFVNPRVLRVAIEEGAFVDDDVTKEYFAGLLASSFSVGGADDRAIMFFDIVRRMGGRAVATHHLLYSIFRQSKSLYDMIVAPAYIQMEMQGVIRGVVTINDYSSRATEAKPAFGDDLFVPYDVFAERANVNLRSHRRHVLRTLVREELLSDVVQPKARFFRADTSDILNGVVVAPSELGAELFLWVHGNADASPDQLFALRVDLRDWQPLPSLPPGVVLGKRLRRQQQALRDLRTAMDACLAATLDETKASAVLPAVRAALSSGWADIADRERAEIEPLIVAGSSVRIEPIYAILKRSYTALSRIEDVETDAF